MGMFGSKKGDAMPMISDVFSAEDLKKIDAVVREKEECGGYGMYSTLAKTMLDMVDDPDREYDKKEWKNIVFAAGAFTRLEPELAPMLKGAIVRFHAIKK